MSKQLLIMRHAKSSWANERITDFERPLNKRGLRVTPQVGRLVHLQGLTPDLIISSTALRARMTTETFAEHCEGVVAENIRFVDSFYHASSSVHLDFLDRFSEPSVETLMFVGHNPGLEDLVEQLSGTWEVMPTAAVAHFDLNVKSWDELKLPFQATIKNLWRPKEINID
jgi:phosphohistidine phosphatase